MIYYKYRGKGRYKYKYKYRSKRVRSKYKNTLLLEERIVETIIVLIE